MSLLTSSSLEHRALHPALAALLGASLLLGAASSVFAGERQVRFVNNTGQAVDDLHIETKQGVTITRKTPFTGDRGVNGGNKHNLYGGTVPNGGRATVKFTSGAPNITIKKWWWTSGGNAQRDGTRVGDVKGDDGGTVLTCTGGPSAGDGQILVSIDRQARIFQTQRGAPPDLTIAMFHEFCESFYDLSEEMSLIHETPLDPFSLEVLGNVLGDAGAQLQVQIIRPDSQQRMQLLPVDTGINLQLDGACPGRVSAIVTNAFPGSPVILAYAFNETLGTQVPGCVGVYFGLRNAVIVGQLPADGNGTAVFRGNVPPAACGRLYIQAAEQARCILSNTERL